MMPNSPHVNTYIRVAARSMWMSGASANSVSMYPLKINVSVISFDCDLILIILNQRGTALTL